MSGPRPINRWELFAGEPGFAAAEKDIDGTVEAAEHGISLAVAQIEAQVEGCFVALDRHLAVGAGDTEPQAHMRAHLRRVLAKRLAPVASKIGLTILRER